MTHFTMTPQAKARLMPAFVAGIVLLVLSVASVPRMVSASDAARADRSRSIEANVRAGIAGFYANTARRGTARFPTASELLTPGAVLAAPLEPNPYNGERTVLEFPGAWHDSVLPTEPTAGWGYDPIHGQFWNAVEPARERRRH